MTRNILVPIAFLIACKGEDSDTDLPVDTDPPVDTDETDLPPDTDVEDTDDTDLPVDTDLPPERFPDCDSVGGLAAVVFTRDELATWSPTDEVLGDTRYTYGLAVDPADPLRLYAEDAGYLWTSADGGCTWESLEELGDTLFHLIPGPDHVFWGYRENGSILLRIEGEEVTSMPIRSYAEGMGVDPSDADHVRYVDYDGYLHETVNGADFSVIGNVSDCQYPYWASFDPNDLDHIVIGGLASSACVSTDGGDSWTTATIPVVGNANVFTVAISPVDGDVVWAEGLDLYDSARYVWRSDDGGENFTAVVDDADDAVLINGNHLFPHPTDADVLYFSWGTYFANEGSYLWRYDHDSSALTVNHHPAHGIDAVAWSPDDPELMYVGLAHEMVSAD